MMEPETTDRAAEIKARLDDLNYVDAEWEVALVDEKWHISRVGDPQWSGIGDVYVYLREEAEFIAAARSDVPWLLADNERLRAELADEKATHAKTFSNFEEYAECQRAAESKLRDMLTGARAENFCLAATVELVRREVDSKPNDLDYDTGSESGLLWLNGYLDAMAAVWHALGGDAEGTAEHRIEQLTAELAAIRDANQRMDNAIATATREAPDAQ